MRPPQYIQSHDHAITCHAIWKESFWRSDPSPEISSRPPKSLRYGAQKNRERKVLKKRKKEKEWKRKRKAPKVSSNKGEVNILRGGKHFNFKNLFYMIFSPFTIPFQKPFPKSLRKFS
jgi:hypothetical protein